jgi:hypothetical protein
MQLIYGVKGHAVIHLNPCTTHLALDSIPYSSPMNGGESI